MFRGTFYYPTEISKPVDEVWAFFQTNENLVSITGFPRIEMLGDREVFEGARVSLKLNFFIISLYWQGRITKVADEKFFIDEGEQLPFPFRSWHHVHAFKPVDKYRTKMIDKVEFSSYIPAWLIKWMLFGMFSDRKRQLKKQWP